MQFIKYEQSHPLPGVVLACSVDLFTLYMSRAFPDGPPWELDKTHVERLEGMKACHALPNPYDELLKAIRRLGAVKVWVDHGDDISVDDNGNDNV